MICTQVTIPELIITNVTASLISAGNIKIRWTQNIPGYISITRNDVEVFTWNETKAGDKNWDSMNNKSGTYIFCVNGICAVPFVHGCISNVWHCEIPNNGYEFDTCGNRRLNPACDISSPPGVDELRIKFTKLPWASETLTKTVLGSIVSACSLIIEPLGYKYHSDKLDWNNAIYSVYYTKIGTPAPPLLAIIGAITGLLLAIGLVIISVAWYKQGVLEEEKYQESVTCREKAEESYSAGKITYTQYMELLAQCNKITEGKPMDWQTVAIYGAGILAGAYILGSILKGGRSRRAKRT